MNENDLFELGFDILQTINSLGNDLDIYIKDNTVIYKIKKKYYLVEQNTLNKIRIKTKEDLLNLIK